MKTIKHIILFLFAGALLLSSCNSLLEEDVRSQIADGYANTPAGFESVVNAAYSHMREFYGSEAGSSLTVFGTDEFTNGSDGSFKSMNFYDSGLSPRVSIITDTWNRFYIAINNCNMAIGRADDVQGLNEEVKAQRVAEVRYLRAFYYFLLVQLWGPVHITLEETQGVVVEASRRPISEVYQVILDDLAYAVENLPPTQSDYGRATRAAAEFLLSKVYLTRAGSEAAGTDDYARAAQLAQNVINNYGHRLLDNFIDVFAVGQGEINDEVVWAVQYSQDVQTVNPGNRVHLFFLMEYDVLPGMQRDIENGRPWKRFRPTDFVLNELYNREDDSRYSDSFKRTFLTNRPGTYNIRGNQVTLNIGDTAVWVPDRELSQAELSQRPYNVYPPSLQNERIYATLTKYLDPTRVDIQTEPGTRDFLVFRLAEAYLIAAEGLYMTGREAEAVEYINTVRRRAAVEGRESAMEVTVGDLSIDFILDERARELLGEHMRWFDLVRTGKLVERVKLHNAQAIGIQDFHALRPIPGTQIDRTEGGASAFPQNPGYEQ